METRRWEGLPGGQRRWISMVLRKQLCWESYFYCKGKTPVVSELWGAIQQPWG